MAIVSLDGKNLETMTKLLVTLSFPYLFFSDQVMQMVFISTSVMPPISLQV